jgi:release factor glutamine methyltransferase
MWGQLCAEAAARLPSRQEAQWLVEEATGEDWVRAERQAATERAVARFDAMVARRIAGEPLQYVLGHWPFRTLDLLVDPRVLIPRPETEQVVEVALRELDRLAGMDSDVRVVRGESAAGGESADRGAVAGGGAVARREEPLVAVDLGTGSGAIALSLAAERGGVEVWATDASPDALAVARANLAGLGGLSATRVRLTEGSWWDALPAELAGRVRLVVSNPPYIATAEMAELDPVVADWEPRQALEAGPQGIEDLRVILEASQPWLAPVSAVVVEIAPHQAEVLTAVALDAGFVAVDVGQDLAGRDRVLVARTVRS